MAEVRVSTRDVQQFEGDALAVGVFSGETALQGPAAALDEALAGVIAELIASGEVSGAADEITLLHTLGKIEPARVAIIGLGARDKFTVDRVRRAASQACRALRTAGAKRVGLALAWAESGVNLALAARAATEGAVLGLYEFTNYKNNSANGANAANAANGQNGKPKKAIETITILGKGREPALRAAVARGRILAESANFARDLGNEPPNTLTPTEMGERARRMAAEVGLECEVHDKAWIRKQEMGALLGVNQGSVEEPRFIVLRYNGGSKRAPAIALVGKGITFDSGGLSLKPNDGMVGMKMDMCGGAAVLGAMRAIALLKPAISVVGIVPATENMPSGSSYRPGDILRASNGKTIEINNTDAEGRLILADGISYAVKHGYTPIVDAATLTGAIGISLGRLRAGLFSNNEDITRSVEQAAASSGERVWAMPMDDEYDQLIRSEIADVKQTGGRLAGSIAAAKVLSNFAGDTPWAHLDIAYTAVRDTRDVEGEAGATGYGVRLFTELAFLLAGRKGE
ncbi:MAG TPA: leucyl aminopeptidase [Ktedonobacterales bacterium]|nr:leucyl aminopeptidase [Ktedonobacterales bacterium]